ncbi:MAG: bifunctional [glutamate--ammonia ligase]-adenylyl-L-tyrosine phosphorylase/[glutamate--ammonia-ligase] adenylyltransferase [Rhodanobacteraceae bacterium]
MHAATHASNPFTRLLDERLTRLERACREAGVPFYDDAGVDEHLQRVLLASDFAYSCFLTDPFLLGPELVRLMGDPRHADARAGVLVAVTDEASFRAELHRFRTREAVRLIWRDVNRLDRIEGILAGASVLAESCLEAALAQVESQIVPRHGLLRSCAGDVQRLVVIALGKLGGGELNFSSDIDLVFAYPETGSSDGARPLDADQYFARVCQQLVNLLAERSADGYAFRVDLRLRPFGKAGRLAQSFAAMELYYQREGRDWERYAWIKARPVAGDKAAGARLLATLRPFVFRRYLDYNAFSGLREMKALIDAEVVRKDMSDHIKLGPGGIREIEFIVQLVQMIRGGREPALRARGLLPALTACEQRGYIPSGAARSLREAYRFLRLLENRLQMYADEQTHELPSSDEVRARIALALDYPDWPALARVLETHRAQVAEEFAALMAPAARARDEQSESPWPAVWRRLSNDGIRAEELIAAGFDPPNDVITALQSLLSSPALASMSARSRGRLDRVLPALMAAAAGSVAPTACLVRLLGLVQAIARRTVYLTLLDEQPAALERVTEVFGHSAFLADHVTQHPLLLDELFANRLDRALPQRSDIAAEIARRLGALGAPDPEAEMLIVQEERLAALFRIGLAFLERRLDAVACARALADAADVVIGTVLTVAERHLLASHGRLDGHIGGATGLAVIGYGSLGGRELGFSSDLDLVFIYDGALTTTESDGEKPLDGARYYARLAQRVIHLLTLPTRAGKPYEIDLRLRPEGGVGLLVTALDAYTAYQRDRARTWEHQALVRARAVAGDGTIARRFDEARSRLLAIAREPAVLCAEIVDMRARWREERDRSDATRLDLKHGPGALVDIEFLLQGLVLAHAHRHPVLMDSGDTTVLISAAARIGILTEVQAHDLAAAHVTMLHQALGCTLDGRSRVVPRTADLDQRTQSVLEIASAHGLDFACAGRHEHS